MGLYLDPPDKALVLCVDEKSQCQALERTQPILPMGLGYVEGVTHDYVRHGTTTLFAALDIANGQVLRQNKDRHRHQEFLGFLRHIDKNVPADLEVHIVLDNYSTHKHAKVKGWLARRDRFRLHFTPTDVRLLAEPGGAVARNHHTAVNPSRFLPECEGACSEDRAVRRCLQQERHAVHVARHRRLHLGETWPPMSAYFRDSTLDMGFMT